MLIDQYVSRNFEIYAGRECTVSIDFYHNLLSRHHCVYDVCAPTEELPSQKKYENILLFNNIQAST